jgi:hypothetical protein
MDQNKPSLFYKINKAVDYSPVNGGLIVLNNLDSGNLTLTVYNHDGAHFNEVSSFNFYVAKPWYFLLDDSIVFGFNWKHIIHYRWNKMRYVQNSNYRKN